MINITKITDSKANLKEANVQTQNTINLSYAAKLIENENKLFNHHKRKESAILDHIFVLS